MRLLVVGGSDAGIAAGLRARQVKPDADVTVLVADAYPNFSICGIPYYISGDVTDWRSLAHRSYDDLTAAGLDLRLDTTAVRIHPTCREVTVQDPTGRQAVERYDELIVATGAAPMLPPITGLDTLDRDSGVHVLHTMSDTFALADTLERTRPRSAVVVGGGYIGLEMVEALASRRLTVTQVEMLPEVLPTVDPDLGKLVHDHLVRSGVEVITSTAVESIARAPAGAAGRLRIVGSGGFRRHADLVLVVAGVRPDTDLAQTAGVALGVRDAIQVDDTMHTGVPHIWAAGDCVVTRHRLLGATYIPLGTTAHKQGRVAGENAAGGHRTYAGSLGTQVVKVFDLVVGRTGLRDGEAERAGFRPLTAAATADDHKPYYPGAHPIDMRWTGDRNTGRLLGVQMVGRLGSEIAKRLDIAATAIHAGLRVEDISDLDLSYTPPLGSPWDAIQIGAQAWERAAAHHASVLT